MDKTKKYWKGTEELNNSADFSTSKNNEFQEYLPTDQFLGDKETLENSSTSRRDFLKYLGFGVTAASLAACETPVNYALPYVVKPDTVTPGVANWYASTFSDGNDYASILVKTREGRPIKIEGNKLSEVTRGGVSARINSSILSLYDGKRIKSPTVDGTEYAWSAIDRTIKADLKKIDAKGGNVRILTNSMTSPSTKYLIEDFKAKFPGANVEHISYDAVSLSGMLKANELSFGKKAVPSYHFDNAKVIVSVGADFLGNWISPVEYAKQYAVNRKPENAWMSKHFQFETTFSMTGTNADYRTPIKPSEHGKVLVALYNYVAAKLGGNKVSASPISADAAVAKAGDALVAAQGASLVITGSNDPNEQLFANGINNLLGNYGKTLNINTPSNYRKGDDESVMQLVADMNAGKVDAIFISGVDPVYSMPAAVKFSEALAKVNTRVSFATRPNETSALCNFITPDNHFLESWNDHNPIAGHYSVSQPVISKLFDTRQFQDSLLVWMDAEGDYFSYMKKVWEEKAYPNQSASLNFTDFWNSVLSDGTFKHDVVVAEPAVFNVELASSASAISKIKSTDWEMEFYQKVGIGFGNDAHNPWLQELPDPVSKITWDNYITMNPSDARELGYATEYGEQKEANTMNITVNGISFEGVPVVSQPGQAKGTLGVALGYGRTIGKDNQIVGFNAYPAVTVAGKSMLTYSTNVSFEKASSTYQIATTQTHQTIMGRDSVVRETTFGVYKAGDKDAFNPPHLLATHEGKIKTTDASLWAKHPVEDVGHRWGMTIDMNSCIGCGACVTSCNSENNVPVVGKDEVRRSREMHWLRIDRYFSSEEEQKSEDDRSYGLMEIAEDNPRVVHQPMMCQHCNHAPCETVCPVAATTHSNEGLNQMTYNRCIGTRYCANNCPYKVRRFNWFNYMGNDDFAAINPSQDDLGRMVLNPDVTVRARGVMEKCSMCVQRIQEGKLTAKKDSRKVMDGEIQTACASACPTDAIVFGDLNDSETIVRKVADSDRSYRVIEEVGTEPNIYYQVKVRNIEEVQA